VTSPLTPSSAEVKNEYELRPLPFSACMAIAGQLLLYINYKWFEKQGNSGGHKIALAE
jgi:hypothetical protein